MSRTPTFPPQELKTRPNLFEHHQESLHLQIAAENATSKSDRIEMETQHVARKEASMPSKFRLSSKIREIEDRVH